MEKRKRKEERGKRRIVLTGVSLSLIFPFLFLISSCAKQGYPTGGPKDTTPPKAVGSKPQNETRHFKGKQFFIEFDEYVVLKNAEQNVLISPPMAQKPVFSTRGMGVQVRLQDTLRPNTTYLFQFKEAIADYNEGNVLPSYEYVFSTGAQMDSLMIAGNVLNARNGNPWGEVLTVVGYRDGDTMPSLVTRTDKRGNFAFHYIPDGHYRLMALDDKNRDLRIDSTEAVAWDTLRHAAADSIDSSALVRLRISAPERRRQRVLKAEFTDRGRIVISTLLPMQHPTLAGEDVEWRLNMRGDTINVWCRNELCDSTVLMLADEGLADTLKLRYRAPSKRGRGRSTSADKPPLMKTLCSGNAAYYDDLRIAFTAPVTVTAAPPEAEIMYLKDSSTSRCPIVLDSSGLRARLETSLKSGEQYRVRLEDSLFSDLYGHPSDSLVFTLTPKDYGILTMHIDNGTGYPLVVEVLDAKDTIVQRQPLAASGTLRFIHLPEAEYRLRAIIDRDGNGQWTTGDYFLRRQPEEILLFGKSLQLREKWELEEKWELGVKN